MHSKNDSFEAKLANRIEKLTHDFRAQKTAVLSIRDLVIHDVVHRNKQDAINPLNRMGCKCFSQTDEDGITLEIARRLGVEDGFYAEFGVGDGLENNTLILAALGWQGFWVGNQPLAIDTEQKVNLKYFKEWITIDNVKGIIRKGVGHFHKELDVISLDLDGNDIYFVEEILKCAQPKLFIVEYNAKFPPPIRFKIDYDEEHNWNGDDYFGASLMSYCDMFESYGYKLVCCNAHSGANAFFIKREHANKFADVPNSINDIYMEPRYHRYTRYGHKTSIRTIDHILS